jgi:hypothetical protein
MRRLLATFGVLLAAVGAVPCAAQSDSPVPAAPAAAPDPANLAIAREIIVIAYPPESRQAMFARLSEAMTAQARDAMLATVGGTLDAEMQRLLARYLERINAVSAQRNRDGAPRLFDAFARAYARQFSHEDLVQIRAFVGTPAGAHFLQRSADLLSDPDVAEANRAYMTDAFRDMQPLIEELGRDVQAYLRRHPRR